MTGAVGQGYDEKAAARILNVAPRTLQRWRQAKLIGHYRTPTGRIRYSLDDLLEVQARGREPAMAASVVVCREMAACVISTEGGPRATKAA